MRFFKLGGDAVGGDEAGAKAKEIGADLFEGGYTVGEAGGGAVAGGVELHTRDRGRWKLGNGAVDLFHAVAQQSDGVLEALRNRQDVTETSSHRVR